jgi:hypothetical protein
MDGPKWLQVSVREEINGPARDRVRSKDGLAPVPRPRSMIGISW